MPVLPLVVWSRITPTAHTLPQALAGAAVGDIFATLFLSGTRRNRSRISGVVVSRMRDTTVIASRVVLAVLVFAAFVTPACAWDSQKTSSGEANGDGWKGTGERSNTARQEHTVRRGERQILTGVITDEEGSSCLAPKRPCGRILVEEGPDADCGGDRGPVAPGCEKMYFDVTGKTDVFRKEGSIRKVASSAADLRKGLRVRADYTGYDVAESYPSQTEARAVTILESP